jgi:hypothetical protein
MRSLKLFKVSEILHIVTFDTICISKFATNCVGHSLPTPTTWRLDGFPCWVLWKKSWQSREPYYWKWLWLHYKPISKTQLCAPPRPLNCAQACMHFSLAGIYACFSQVCSNVGHICLWLGDLYIQHVLVSDLNVCC